LTELTELAELAEFTDRRDSPRNAKWGVALLEERLGGFWGAFHPWLQEHKTKVL
jgi:hypothetical protein